MSVPAAEDPGPPNPGDDNNPPVNEDPEKSFRDTLLTGMQIDDQGYEEDQEEDRHDNGKEANTPLWDPSDVVDSINGIWPSVQVADKVVARFAEPWRRFSNDADWVHALVDGPWIVLGTYLTVLQWSPNFDIEKGITKVTAWVRFPKLPVHWYNKQFMAHLDNLVGKTIKIDMNTQQGNRGRFAMVVVSLDMNKPLLDRFELNEKWYRIEYEGIQTICFTCGCMGHSTEKCSVTPKPKQNTVVEETQVNGEVSAMPTEKSEVDPGNNQTTEPEVETRFGPWMQVRRSKRPVRRGSGNGDNANQNWKQIDTNPIFGTDEEDGIMRRGSRYGVLIPETEGQQEFNEGESSGPILETSKTNKEKEKLKGNENRRNNGKPKELMIFGATKQGNGLTVKGPMDMGEVVLQKEVIGLRPITVGPLSHGLEVNVSTERGMNGKMRKLQASKGNPGTSNAEQQVAIEGARSDVNAGNQQLSTIMKETTFWKPLARQKPVRLGKRKSVPNYPKEQPPNDPGGAISEESTSILGVTADSAMPQVTTNEAETEAVEMENDNQGIRLDDQADPQMLDA